MLRLPALYDVADALSGRFQKQYLVLISVEYVSLLAASVLGLTFERTPGYFVISAITLLSGLITLLYRSVTRPEQKWYRARAVAESIKTSAWRYAMIAHPYDEVDARPFFLQMLRGLLTANKVLYEESDTVRVDDEQITAAMTEARTWDLKTRVSYYFSNRVAEQRAWYLKKAKGNRAAFRRWVWLSGAAYCIAIALSLTRIAAPNWKYFPIDPLIVFASSAVGWIQIKKYSELSSSYTLTATEIGLAVEEIGEIDDNDTFSDVVNDMELAFSREHTQWIARQQTAG